MGNGTYAAVIILPEKTSTDEASQLLSDWSAAQRTGVMRQTLTSKISSVQSVDCGRSSGDRRTLHVNVSLETCKGHTLQVLV